MLGGLGRWVGGTVRRDAGLAFAGQFEALFNFSKIYHALFSKGDAAPERATMGSGPASTLLDSESKASGGMSKPSQRVSTPPGGRGPSS